MLDVHGEEVAGATFPVPIWHLYMAAAEKGLPGAPVPDAERLPGLQAVHAGLLGLPGTIPTTHDDHHHDDRQADEGRTVRLDPSRRRPSAVVH